MIRLILLAFLILAVPASAARQSTVVIHVNPQAITNGVLTRVPASGAVAVKSKGFAAVKLAINLTTADKEAVGKTLAFNLYAEDGTFVAGFSWTSYSQRFTITAPDGTVIVDPDPTITINIDQLGSKDVYLTYLAGGIGTAGITVTGLT